MLQSLENIYATQIIGAVAPPPRPVETVEGSQDTELSVIIFVIILLCVCGGFALGCVKGSQRYNGRSGFRPRYDEAKSPRSSSRSPLKPAESPPPRALDSPPPAAPSLNSGSWNSELPPSDIPPNIYLLVEGLPQGPYPEDQILQFLVEDIIPPDLPAWCEGLAEWVEVQSLFAPVEDPSLFPPPPEEVEEPIQVEAVENKPEAIENEPPQMPDQPSMLEPKLVEMMSKMTKRKPASAKKKKRAENG